MKLLIDAHNYIKRVYHGGRDPYEMFSDLMSKNTDSQVFMVCDTSSSRAYRKAIHPNYKNRPSSDDNVYFTIYENIVTMARHYPNVTVIQVTDGEADDYIQDKAEAGDTVISNDKDLWPLLSKNVNIYINGTSKVDRQLVQTHFISDDPRFIVLFKALVGDTGDKIPGKRGFGKVAYEKLTDIDRAELLAKLENNKIEDSDLLDAQVAMSYTLAKPYADYKFETMSSISTPLRDFLEANSIMLLE